MGIFSGKIVSNSLWMMLEKLVAMIGLIFVNSYMAKYVGPDNFGKIIFSSSLFVFIQSLAWFGAQNVYFKRMSENRKSGIKLAIANLRFRRLIFLISSVLLLSYLYLYNEFVVFVFGLASFIASYYTISDILSIYNNSQLRSFINALTNIVGLVVALIIRFLFVYNEAHIYYMTIPIVLVVMIPYILRSIIYKKENISCLNLGFKQRKKYNKYLINTGGALLLSSISIIIYTQISSIFLAKYTSYTELGIYNVAMTLGGAWSFVGAALITSIFSRIYSEKSQDKLTNLFAIINYIMLTLAALAYVFFLLTGGWWINTLYGQAYQSSEMLLGWVVLATLFSNMGTICYRYMLKYGGYQYLSIKMLIVSLISIPLSYCLIKVYGVFGAVYCFVLVELISLTIANYFFKSGLILKMYFKCLNICRVFK